MEWRWWTRDLVIRPLEVSIVAIGSKYKVMLRQPAVSKTKNNVHKVGSRDVNGREFCAIAQTRDFFLSL